MGYRHPGNVANILFVDGHVEGMHLKELKDYDRYWNSFWDGQGPAVAE